MKEKRLLRILDRDGLRDEFSKNKATYKDLYVTKDFTAQQVAHYRNIKYSNDFAKILIEVIGTKGKGRGGERPGSGNKKGVTFCTTCKKTPKNCTCPKES